MALGPPSMSRPLKVSSGQGLTLPDVGLPSFSCFITADLRVWRAARDSNPNRQIRSLAEGVPAPMILCRSFDEDQADAAGVSQDETGCWSL
jgi:hypothetical protein